MIHVAFQGSSWSGRREPILVVVRAPKFKRPVEVEAVVEAILSNKVEGNKEEEVVHSNKEEGDGLLRLNVEETVGVAEVVECHKTSSINMVGLQNTKGVERFNTTSSSSNMVALLLNIKEEEGVGLLNRVVEEDIAVVVKEELLVAHPDPQFPNCTKQPKLHMQLG